MSFKLFDMMETFSSRCVEPEKRMVAGRYGYAVHRFPIKGGIRFIDAMTDAISPTETPFMAQILKKRREQ